MAGDRRFLFRGNLDEASGQVFIIGPTPTGLTAAGLGSDTPVRVQVLAGDNYRRADETDWADATASNGRPLVLSLAHSYILMTQPGRFRLHPTDLANLSTDARVWLEDAFYKGQDRIVYTTDLHGGYGDATPIPPEVENPACVTGQLVGMAFTSDDAGQPYVMPPLPAEVDYVVVTMQPYTGAEEGDAPDCIRFGFGEVTDPEVETMPFCRCSEMLLCPEEYAQIKFYGPAEQRLAVRFYRL